MKTLKTVSKLDLNILQTSKKGTLILDNNDYTKFGIEGKPFNLSALPKLNSLGELIYEIKFVWRSFSNKNVSDSLYVKLV